MLQWIKQHTAILITVLTCVGFFLYCYGCEPKVRSLSDRNHLVNRQELQLELDQFITTAQFRMADLDRQDAFKAIFLQNALVLVQGQPLNPVGIITAIAAVYGAAQGTVVVKNAVKTAKLKRKVNNGTG